MRRFVRSRPRLHALARGVRSALLGVPEPAARPSPSPLDDRIRELRPIDPRRSVCDEIRLNLLIPTVREEATFGGVSTALHVFEAIGEGVVRRRIVTQVPLAAARASFGAYERVVLADDPGARLSIVAFDGVAGTLPIGPRDVFVATFWNTADAAFRLRDWQAATYGWAPRYLGYVIQDFEPGFYPWSAQHLLARATYARPAETIGIFNSGLLRDYFHGEGISFAKEVTFEPRLPAALRAYVPAGPSARERRIVVYGRPRTPRNGFPLIMDALRCWRAAYATANGWEVVSAGQPHEDVDLGGGTTLHSVGKLDLDAYGRLLATSAVGVALMVSPHPSYVPLEMAHLGMRVVTNRFGAKDLSAWHPNIVSVADASPEALASAIAAACHAFETEPMGGAPGTLRPDYLSDDPRYPFAAEVAAALVSTANGSAGYAADSG